VWNGRVWRPDLERAAEFIADRNPEAARGIVDRVLNACEGLGRQPTGRPGRVGGTFEKVIGRTPYIVASAREGERVLILRVIHAARNWTPERWTDV
jgi:plasmid stabilization system protein ParE